MKKDFQEFKNYIKGKKVAVVGVGVSNIPLIKFLKNTTYSYVLSVNSIYSGIINL